MKFVRGEIYEAVHEKVLRIRREVGEERERIIDWLKMITHRVDMLLWQLEIPAERLEEKKNEELEAIRAALREKVTVDGCSVCNHADRLKMERLLKTEGEFGEDFLARRYSLEPGALKEHRLNHLYGQISITLDGSMLINELQRMMQALHGEITVATDPETKDKNLMFRCFSEMRAQIKLAAELMGLHGELGSSMTRRQEQVINRVLDVLSAHPEARAMVARALEGPGK